MRRHPINLPEAGRFLGPPPPWLPEALAALERQDTVGRIWRRDHTLWKPDPTEIADRLGWLDVDEAMRRRGAELHVLCTEVLQEGLFSKVLLGMGGSSLGVEVLAQILAWSPGTAMSGPAMVVLDSTLPERVQEVTSGLDPANTLFLVSSKSGGTLETLSLYRHFREVVERAVGMAQAGRHFVAITDPGTPLETLGREAGFRRVLLNPPDIGGRYSVLSLFGLAPAAVMPIPEYTDWSGGPHLLDGPGVMRVWCSPSAPLQENPGAWLGAVLGGACRQGRNKLTLVCSPGIASFGLWAEQLLAESTGKEGKGIIPVVGEPLAAPQHYGPDRLFAYCRLMAEPNPELDARMEEIAAAGHPVACLEWPARLALAAEFYRWQFATAVAGAMLGINPFDQPDVQSAKDSVLRALGAGQGSRGAYAPGSLRRMLDAAAPGSYLAILAYLSPTPEVEAALEALRRAVLERWSLPVTLGYGPRYLHSTGQLHKGGPPLGLFLMLTQDHASDLPIPGQDFTFGALADAQALGDVATLQARGRPAVHRHLDTDPVAGLRRLLDELA